MTRSQAAGTIPLQAYIRDALRIAAQRTSDALAQALMRDAADKLDRLESERADLYAALRDTHRALVALEAAGCSVESFRERYGAAGWDDFKRYLDDARAMYGAARAEKGAQEA